MGLFDSSGINLDDPKELGILAMAAGLLSPTPTKVGFGGQLSQGLLGGINAYSQGRQAQLKQQADERANRASDLQQASGAYQLLKQQEFGRMAQAQAAGQPYTPNPLLAQLEGKIGQLTGLSNMSGQSGAPGSAPSGGLLSTGAPAPAVPAPVASQYSPAVKPEYQAQGPMPAPQSSTGGIGGSAGGIPMQWWLAQDPTGAKYLEQLAKDNSPQNVRPGGSLAVKGNDGQYRTAFFSPQMVPGVAPQRDASGNLSGAAEIPGFAQAASNIKGQETTATERAKAPYDIHMVPTASGATIPMSTAQITGPQAGGMPFVSPQPQTARPGVASLTVTQPSRQSQAQPQGQPPDPWTTVPTLTQPQGLGQSTQDKEMAVQRALTAKETAQELGTTAAAASQRMAINNQALDLVDKADTGWLANHISEFRNVLGSLGVKSAADQAATDQTLGKDLIGTALQKGKQLFGSRFTQSEVGIMLSRASPSPEMQSAAIKFLLQTDNATQQYAIQQGQDFGKYLGMNGDPFAYKSWYAAKIPMTDALKSVHMGAQVGARPPLSSFQQ